MGTKNNNNIKVKTLNLTNPLTQPRLHSQTSPHKPAQNGQAHHLLRPLRLVRLRRKGHLLLRQAECDELHVREKESGEYPVGRQVFMPSKTSRRMHMRPRSDGERGCGGREVRVWEAE